MKDPSATKAKKPTDLKLAAKKPVLIKPGAKKAKKTPKKKVASSAGSTGVSDNLQV